MSIRSSWTSVKLHLCIQRISQRHEGVKSPSHEHPFRRWASAYFSNRIKTPENPPLGGLQILRSQPTSRAKSGLGCDAVLVLISSGCIAIQLADSSWMRVDRDLDVRVATDQVMRNGLASKAAAEPFEKHGGGRPGARQCLDVVLFFGAHSRDLAPEP